MYMASGGFDRLRVFIFERVAAARRWGVLRRGLRLLRILIPPLLRRLAGMLDGPLDGYLTHIGKVSIPTVH